MPPKVIIKKKKSSNGTSNRKKKKSIKSIPIQRDNVIPYLPEIKTNTLLSTVITPNTSMFTTLVKHYNYSDHINRKDINNSTALHLAAKLNNINQVRNLLSYNIIDVNLLENKAIGGYAIIHHACHNNNIDILNLLLSHHKTSVHPSQQFNLDIQTNSNFKFTALHICCKFGYIHCAKLLLLHNASLSIPDAFGNNVSHWCRMNHHDQMIIELQLPDPKYPSPEEFFKHLSQNITNYKLPSITKKTTKITKKKKNKN